MSNEGKLEMEGIVTKVLKGANFEVKLNDNDHMVICTLSGKLRMNKIRVLQGDSVTVSISPYDLTRGIITWRNK